MSDPSHHLLLIGGGHAHVAVLADWAQNGLPCERATLLTPAKHLRYSGMVPGWIAGQYTRDEGQVDLEALAAAAGAQLVLDRCVGVDPMANAALTQESGVLRFDIASIDVGGVGRANRLLGDDLRLIDVRPIDGFVARIADRLSAAGSASPQICVIGGGAGGVELAFALKNSARLTGAPGVTMVTGEQGLLPGFAEGVQRRVRARCAVHGITLVEADARMAEGVLDAGGRSIEPVDVIVAALGSDAPGWLRASGLEVDEGGFVAVDRYQRSISHSHIFAAGDCASRMDTSVPHSGVHAVHTGPVLAANLRAVMAGGGPRRSYTPRPQSLYLISTGDGSAIGSYGPFAFQGRWAKRLKHWIDKNWISKYAQLAGLQ